MEKASSMPELWAHSQSPKPEDSSLPSAITGSGRVASKALTPPEVRRMTLMDPRTQKSRTGLFCKTWVPVTPTTLPEILTPSGSPQHLFKPVQIAHACTQTKDEEFNKETTASSAGTSINTSVNIPPFSSPSTLATIRKQGGKGSSTSPNISKTQLSLATQKRLKEKKKKQEEEQEKRRQLEDAATLKKLGITGVDVSQRPTRSSASASLSSSASTPTTSPEATQKTKASAKQQSAYLLAILKKLPPADAQEVMTELEQKFNEQKKAPSKDS